MSIRLPVWTLSFGLVLALAPFSLSAQQGTLTGTVTDELSRRVVPGTEIQILGGGQTRTVLADAQGQYRIELPAGRYDLVVERVFPFRNERFSNVRVSPGETNTYDLSLTSDALPVVGINVTVDRSSDPGNRSQTTFNVEARDIVGRANTNPTDLLARSPAVDIIKAGIQTGHVVVRGFNNIFSGALHMLTDYRVAGVPSLRVNLMHFMPHIDEDLDRIEVVLGPSSALYGPNTANGIIHFITKSPLESQGTTVTFGGGEQSVFQGSLRSAFLLSDNFGFKISGEYMRGDEWNYTDLTEEDGRLANIANPALCVADKVTRGLSPADATIACERLGVRDFGVERWSVEARADYRFADDGTIVGTYGRNTSSGIELTGLGAGQTSEWVSDFFQARIRKGRFFGQAYYNRSDAGDSFLLRNGVALVDQSTLFGATVQHGFTLAEDRQEFTYGGDYFATRPDSRGTIYGSYEDDDAINEWGGYLQSRTALSDQLDFIVAGRLDSNSLLPSNVFSTRAAFVLQPKPGHSIRLSYNRAFSTPTALNAYLDISGGLARGDAGLLGYSTRAFGAGLNGWSLQESVGTVRGMRSPFNPAGAGGAAELLTADAGTLWQMSINALEALGEIDAATAGLLRTLPSPTNSDVARRLRDANTGEYQLLAGAFLPDLPAIRESYTETLELGWTGLIADDRISITADVYIMQKNDFVSPLVVETPLIYLQEDDLVAYLTPFLTAVLGPVAGPAQAAALGAGVAQIPLAVVSSNQVGAQGADLIASYRNVGDITLWGADFAFQFSLTPRWMLGGSYSHMSDDYIQVTGGLPLALNAPKDKGSLSLTFRDVFSGFTASGGVRFTSSFPAQSADFQGTACITGGGGLFEENCVDTYAIFDLNAAYEVPNTAATLQLSVSNVFDTAYRSFPGVPKIGRLAMVRVRYELF